MSYEIDQFFNIMIEKGIENVKKIICINDHKYEKKINILKNINYKLVLSS